MCIFNLKNFLFWDSGLIINFLFEKREIKCFINLNPFLYDISVEHVVCVRKSLVKAAHSIVNSSVMKSEFTANVSQPWSRMRFLLQIKQNLKKLTPLKPH